MMLTTAVVAALTLAASPADAGESPIIPRAGRAISAAGPTNANAARQEQANARQAARRYARLPRVSHADEDGPQGSGARHGDGPVGTSRKARDAAAAQARRPVGVGRRRRATRRSRGPWGISYAINLTSDPDTGIGKWREEDFVQAMKTGKHMGVGPADHAADAVARVRPALGARSSRRCTRISRPSLRSRTACPTTRRRNDDEAPYRLAVAVRPQGQGRRDREGADGSDRNRHGLDGAVDAERATGARESADQDSHAVAGGRPTDSRFVRHLRLPRLPPRRRAGDSRVRSPALGSADGAHAGTRHLRSGRALPVRKRASSREASLARLVRRPDAQDRRQPRLARVQYRGGGQRRGGECRSSARSPSGAASATSTSASPSGTGARRTRAFPDGSASSQRARRCSGRCRPP